MWGGLQGHAGQKSHDVRGLSEPTYYIHQQDALTPIDYTYLLTFSGNTLMLEVGLSNAYGTKAQPKDGSGKSLTLPSNSLLSLQPIIDGVVLNRTATVPVVGMNTSAGLTDDNGGTRQKSSPST